MVSRAQDLQWRLEAVLFAGYFGLMRALPTDWASGLGAALLKTLGPLTGAHRTAERNLRLAFPEKDAAWRRRMLKAQWDNTGRTFAETPILNRMTVASGRVELVDPHGRLKALADGAPPVVFVSGHFACFEIMPLVILEAGVPCQITYRATNNPYVDRIIRDSRARYGVKLFAPKGAEGARELLDGLKRGESAALMNDQKFNEGPEVLFFGKPVNAAPGPSRLAQRFGTVLQPMSVERIKGARFRVVVHDPIPVPKTGDKAADVAAATQAVTRFVEDQVRRRPEEWFWVHKRWPNAAYAALEA
ncbi:lysophospholipid acyltransferase family protein [Brevundimonas sp. 2R-24]|uniref:Lysophospholipid acyltransferase family protein n=1 Tax=Peiella sedimenti TaxID=3061083 RepID=A0ABT8SJV5_9CAUL|nr:lysophospholipid acyltransferase family protein [Caulobacteraceae bacterium XZ-24]